MVRLGLTDLTCERKRFEPVRDFSEKFCDLIGNDLNAVVVIHVRHEGVARMMIPVVVIPRPKFFRRKKFLQCGNIRTGVIAGFADKRSGRFVKIVLEIFMRAPQMLFRGHETSIAHSAFAPLFLALLRNIGRTRQIDCAGRIAFAHLRQNFARQFVVRRITVAAPHEVGCRIALVIPCPQCDAGVMSSDTQNFDRFMFSFLQERIVIRVKRTAVHEIVPD